jgi:hypothetical protein
MKEINETQKMEEIVIDYNATHRNEKTNEIEGHYHLQDGHRNVKFATQESEIDRSQHNQSLISLVSKTSKLFDQKTPGN